MAGLSCALSGASCCVLPTYFEATRFLSGYCGALCFIFCQVIIKDCPDIYSFDCSVCVFLPSYFEATGFLSGYCGALCFIFCQVIIKDCPDIYSYFSSSTECLNFSHHNVCYGVTCKIGRASCRDRV